MDLRRLARVAALGGTAFAVGVIATGRRGHETDATAFRAVNRGAGPAADRFFTGVTELGSIWASIGAAAALAAFGDRRAAGKAGVAAGVAWVVGQELKRVFERFRPYEADPEAVRLLIDPPRASSWPSSHPAVLLTFVTVAGRETGLPSAARAGLTALAVVVAASRVYVGAHYPGDVVGGLLIGRAIGEALSAEPRSTP